MGCIWGKMGGGPPRETIFSTPRQRRRASEAAFGGVSEASFNAIKNRKEESTSSDVNKARWRRNSDNYESRNENAGEFWRPSPGVNNGIQNEWPPWLMAVAAEAIGDWKPRRASSFEKLEKIGQGTYSNVYKAREILTGRIVALKKVRFDNLETESVKFLAREILVLRKLDHPNVLKLQGLATSRMSSSLYLIFEYMEHDLAGLAASQYVKFSHPQIKCLMKQLLLGLEHCHNNGVLHRDIKGSNLLIDDNGVLKIADFGLATFYNPERQVPMTTRVVTLWYRPPELLLGSQFYDVGVDLWSAGCILAELLAGKPIMPGRTEVEQLHKIFKLCGSPPEEYWKKFKLPNATLFKPQHPYKRCVAETFQDFPPFSLSLIETLLSLDPDQRGTATSALNSEFLNNEPLPCEPSSIPKYPPSKELDMKLREDAKREKGNTGKSDAARRRTRDRIKRAVPAPEANAELPANLDRWKMIKQASAKSRSEKFPPPHEDAAVGHSAEPLSFGASEGSFASSATTSRSVGRAGGSSKTFMRALNPSNLSKEFIFKGKSAIFRGGS